MSSNFEPSHQKINKNIDNRGKNQIQSNICWSTFCVAQYVLNLIFLHFKYFIAVVKAIKAYVKRIMIFGTLHQNWLMLGGPAQQLSRLNIKLELFLILSKPDQTKPATATSHKEGRSTNHSTFYGCQSLIVLVHTLGDVGLSVCIFD